MATQWSLATRANRASAMVTVSTRMAESFVIVGWVSVCRVLATLKEHTVNAADVVIMALR